jgi:hypothetical protein
MNTQNISLEYLLQNQASPEITINEALTKIDALIFNIAQNIVDVLPLNPNNGEVYICSHNNTEQPNKIAIYLTNKSWVFLTAKEGMIIFVQSQQKEFKFSQNNWEENNVPSLLPSNVNFDDNNGNTRLNINKSGETTTASHVFKSNWGGRAEFGLIGEDNFSIKVSPNGSNFIESFKVEKNTGNVDFKQNISKNGKNLVTEESLTPYAKTSDLTPFAKTTDLTPYAILADVSRTNFILNGNFDAWQRGTSFTSTGNIQYFADRWCGRRADGTSIMQVSRISSVVPIYSTYIMRTARTVGDASASNIGICQILDSTTVQRLASATMTISAKVRLGAGFGNSSGKIKMQLIAGTALNEGGNPFAFTTGSVVLGEVQTGTGKDIWHDVQLTATLGSSVKSLMVSFISESPTGTATANDYFDISQVKLEIGSSKTVFMPLDPNRELMDCQYFYERISASTANAPTGTIAFADGTNILRAPLLYKQKRKAPIIRASAQNAFNILRFGTDTTTTAIAFATITPFSARMDITTAGTLTGGEACMPNFYNSSQFIEIDAEVY